MSQPPRRKNTWEVGDVVEVKASSRVTNLGRGSILDIETDSNKIPIQALVRFEHGPAKGVWYSLGNLHQISDILGNPL